jgi:hypothetical protein
LTIDPKPSPATDSLIQLSVDSSLARTLQIGRRLLPWIALATIPFCFLCLFVSISDLHTYPGVDLRVRVAGARALDAGLDPYDMDGLAAHGDYFKAGNAVSFTPALLALYIPLSKLPFRTQRTIYFWMDWMFVAGAFYLLKHSFCKTRESVYLCWIVFAIFIVCSYSFRFHLERGQSYMFLMLLTCYLAAAVKNHWTGWISCLPVALLLLVRPTYALIFVAALACPGMSKWFIRLLLVTIAIFAMTLHYDGIARWLEFPVQVRASQAVRMERNRTLCCNPHSPPDTPAPNVIEGIDFGKMLPPHAINGTFLGIVSLGFVHAGQHFSSACRWFSVKWITRANNCLMALILAGGLAVAWAARRRKVSQNVLIAFMVLLPLVFELCAPERFFYTAVVEVLPLLLLLLDRSVLELALNGRAGAYRWLALIALGILPPAIMQIVPFMRVLTSLMSVLILLALPIALAAFCAWAVFSSPSRTDGTPQPDSSPA